MTTTHDPLVAAIDRLQRAVAADWHNHEQAWKAQLLEALRGVEQALGRQPPPTDKIVEVNVELQRREISPGVTRAARTLRHDQEQLFTNVDRLASELEHAPGDVTDLSRMADVGGELVKGLHKFCTATNNLVFDNVLRDTGAGD